jgi:hypothetical protein
LISVVDVDWKAIFNLTQLVNLLILVVVTVLAILLNSSAIEEETGSVRLSSQLLPSHDLSVTQYLCPARC